MGHFSKLAAAAGALAAAGACNSTVMVGSMPLQGGSQSEVWLAGGGGTLQSGELHIQHNSGFTAFSQCAADWEPERIHNFKLLGQRMSFEVDLARVGCACNLAFYLIGAPARGYDGKFNRGDDRGGQPPYYCDANMVGGQWCPEMDIMEANNHVFQATAHSCDKPVNGHYFFCDRSGCDESTKDHAGAYGPHSNYTIDTRHKFSVHTDFLEGDGKFTGMVTTLQQGSKKVILDHGKCKLEYLDKLSDVLRDGMSLRITYWGGDAQTMAWMDKSVCSQGLTCSGKHAGGAVISKVAVAAVPESAYREQAERLKAEREATTTTETPWWAKPQAQTTQEPWWKKAQEQQQQQAQQPTQKPVWTEQWVSDIYQPWMCHTYENPKQEMAKWCVTAGFQDDGFEYSYNAGVGSPCGECFCCKRRAKRSWAPQTTPPPAPLESVWVVADPKDERFGEIVPASALDRSHFVSLGLQGVVNWQGSNRFVKEMSRAEAANVKNEGLGIGSVIMKKYDADETVAAMVGWQRWLTVSGVPGCLLVALLAFAAVGFGLRRLRRSSAPCTPPSTPRGGQRRLPVPQTPASSSASPAAAAMSPGFGMISPAPIGPSPLRRNRSGGQMLLARSASGSSQNLLDRAAEGWRSGHGGEAV